MRNVINELLALERDAREAARVEDMDEGDLQAEITRRVSALVRDGDARIYEIEQRNAAEAETRLMQIAEEYRIKTEALEASFSENRAETVAMLVRRILYGDDLSGCAAE